jgi:RNA polymerase sigma factor (sigma-70 family)
MARFQADAVRRHIHTLIGRQHDARATDRELLERFARCHDDAAFEALFRRHGPMVLATGRRVLSNAHDAEDVCQAAFLLLAQKASSPRWQTSVAGWLYQTAYLLALKVRTAATRRARRERSAAPPQPANPLAEITGQELLAALDEELHALPEPLRAPLVLCHLEGATRDEASRQLACPLATLKKRLERGRRQLRAALARRGLGLSAVLPATLLTRQTGDTATAGVLARKTAAAARGLAAGKTAEPIVSAPVRWLVRGGRGLQGWNNCKAVLTLLVAGALLATAGALAHSGGRDGQPRPAAQDAAAPRDRNDRRPAPAPARAPGTTVRYRFKPGDRLHYVVERRMEVHISATGIDQTNVATHTCDVTWKVGAVDAAGNARVTLTVDRVRFVEDNSIAGRVEFDSKKHTKPVGALPLARAGAAVLKALAGSEFTCAASPRGRISDFKVPRKLANAVRGTPGLRMLYAAENLQQQFACPGSVVLPTEALSPGGRWYDKTVRAVVGGHVRLTVNTGASYPGRADGGGKRLEEISLEPSVTAVGLAPGSFLDPFVLRKQEGKGRMLFDNDRGRLVESAISQSVELESGTPVRPELYEIKLGLSAKLVSPR